MMKQNKMLKWVLAATVLVATQTAFAAENVKKTRYGQVQIKVSPETGQETLYFNHKMVLPKIEGNNGLSIEGIYKLHMDDVVLVQDIGGSGCPIQLNFVKISPNQKVTVSPVFGSCSDLIKVSAKPNQIIVSMPDFMGAPESEEQERKVAQKKMIYSYDGKLLKENGKLLLQE
ncbi:hypothetical protein [Acinetobacter gyllenbergii]|uniref:DUF306 domain-containing protein n=1 Tax=Acinetobacter gyllenbergii CIP 110306 = MTCC 11365 TaxID=1217657 RepID=A0A829HHP4_9GAMM|nr:hypothetical protein [Acinetobacter gyllenbergii]EPF77489.1 hypothetical protein F957_02661 [Acinetobacter gyllenbergii CIP 110306 = MTCC 11365]EPH33344.1 hypothetical protein L293_0944 [Acinetobacter gyllenbergii CIP 110306 = MTCC 11365]